MEEIKGLLKRAEPVKWLFYGDSITHGAKHTYGERDYTQLFAERVRFELGRAHDIVLNTAISGNTTLDLLASFDWRVAQFQPDVVFLMIGMNDHNRPGIITPEEFGQNLRELADRIATWGGRTVLQTTCPMLPSQPPEQIARFGRFMDEMRAVAAQRGLPLIDHARYWADHADHHYSWMNNPSHPNAYGHRTFAALLYRALDIYDPQSPCCRLFIP